MATPYFHNTNTNSHPSVISPKQSYVTSQVFETKDNDIDNKDDDLDEDVLRYNKRLKERRDRLLEEYIRLEQDNKTHCDTLRELLKPFDLTNKHKTTSVTGNKENKLTKKPTKASKASKASKTSKSKSSKSSKPSKSPTSSTSQNENNTDPNPIKPKNAEPIHLQMNYWQNITSFNMMLKHVNMKKVKTVALEGIEEFEIP